LTIFDFLIMFDLMKEGTMVFSHISGSF
jgi:hypothetical protein